MQRFWANFWRIWDAAGSWLLSARGSRLAVIVLLGTQAGLLAYSATRHSPTHLEPAFLAAGISHWQFGRFELYRVNPPLVRMVAALPVLAVGCETDWSRFYEGPGSRAEFPLGEDFIKANGPASIPLFFYARWACIPFNLIGSFFAYRWAKELYGGGAGLLTMTLYVFEPNLLAHGELITPDGACTAFGILAGYTFWRWLKQPTWTRALLAGGALGLAELSKMSWLILFGLWPALWLVWRWLSPSRTTKIEPQESGTELISSPQPLDTRHVPLGDPQPPCPQLATILLLGLYFINLGYAFDGSFTPLKDLTFVSRLMSGLEKAGQPGNRFQTSWLGEIPVPLPKQFVLGFDSQKKDFEHYDQPSYLRGEWKQGGWWYYYLYGLLVKVPCGALGILSLVIIERLVVCNRSVQFRDEVLLLTPAVTIFLLVSSQTAFNQHLRYVFPSLGLTLVFLGQGVTRTTLVFAMGNLKNSSTIVFIHRECVSVVCSVLLSLLSIVSMANVYPHHLAYFNELAGGPSNGANHLLGSSFDWGQDVLFLLHYIAQSQQKVGVITDHGYVSNCLAPGLPWCSFKANGSDASIQVANKQYTHLVVPAHGKSLLDKRKFLRLEKPPFDMMAFYSERANRHEAITPTLVMASLQISATKQLGSIE